MSKRLSLLKYHGGKFYLAPWIISLLPAHRTYVEPFGGAGTVLFNKPHSEYEVYNDLEPGVACLMKCMKEQGPALIEAIKPIQYTEAVFLEYLKSSPTDELQRAIRSYVLYRMSRGGLRRAFCWSKRLAADGTPAEVFYWESAKSRLHFFVERIKNVTVYNELAVGVIKRHDSEETVFYCDPPYLQETRYLPDAYYSEMTETQHEELADTLNSVKGKVVLSGYESPKYAEWYKGWTMQFRDVYNHSSQAPNLGIVSKTTTKPKVRECVWMNFTPVAS